MAKLKDIKSREDIKITLSDGVERTIKFDLNAMAALEEIYGSVDKAFEELDKNSIKALRCVLWAGLMHEDENLTEKQVGSLIDIRLMNEIVTSLGSAFEADMPNAESAGVVTSADPN